MLKGRGDSAPGRNDTRGSVDKTQKFFRKTIDKSETI